MSGFTARNSRIRVVETVSSVDQTVFDTNDDMPHIVATTFLSGQIVDFSNLTQTQNFWFYDPCAFYFTFWELQYHPFYEAYAAVQVTQCTGAPLYEYSVDAREYSSETTIANLPVDEDGNVVDIDFVVVQATGVRTLAGKDPRFNQALPTTLPPKTFSFQGSVLLETSGKANGDSWLRRIMSVYKSGPKLKMKVQESTASLVRGAINVPFPYVSSSRSTYSFSLKVFFGKFRQ